MIALRLLYSLQPERDGHDVLMTPSRRLPYCPFPLYSAPQRLKRNLASHVPNKELAMRKEYTCALHFSQGI